MNVWTRVVEDLEQYGAKERKRKSTISKVVAFLRNTIKGNREKKNG